MKDIYYGRFDLKCKSIELLEEGKGIKILEFNGVDRDIYRHFKIIYQIGEAQKKKGVESMSFKEIKTSYQKYNAYLESAKI